MEKKVSFLSPLTPFRTEDQLGPAQAPEGEEALGRGDGFGPSGTIRWLSALPFLLLPEAGACCCCCCCDRGG